jgi:superfamily II DNA or RNA helicase
VAKELHCQLIDEREPVAEPKALAKFLRPYQGEAVETGFLATRGILSAPTGAGKTLMTAGLCTGAEVAWLYLVHRPNLVAQTAKKLRELLSEPVAEIRGGVDRLDDARIVCATFDSFRSHRFASYILDRIGGLIVDEVHRAPTATALACLVNTEKAYYRIGLSATPLLRTDTRDIQTIGLFGPVIHEVGAQELVEQGFLTDLVFHWLPVALPWFSGSADWQKFYDEAVVNSHDRNTAIIQAAVRAPKPAIVFAKKRAHAQLLTEGIQAALASDNAVELVNGDCSTKEREGVIERTRSGETKVIVATAVFYEGVDIPEVASVIIASGGSSAIEAIQRIGRGTRIHEGKTACHIYDVADYGHHWLRKHTEDRFNAYQLAGWNVRHPFPNEASTPEVNVPGPWLTWGKITWFWVALGTLCTLARTLMSP